MAQVANWNPGVDGVRGTLVGNAIDSVRARLVSSRLVSSRLV